MGGYSNGQAAMEMVLAAMVMLQAAMVMVLIGMVMALAALADLADLEAGIAVLMTRALSLLFQAPIDLTSKKSCLMKMMMLRSSCLPLRT